MRLIFIFALNNVHHRFHLVTTFQQEDNKRLKNGVRCLVYCSIKALRNSWKY